jgi:DNA-binding SARP family transcriptional activator
LSVSSEFLYGIGESLDGTLVDEHSSPTRFALTLLPAFELSCEGGALTVPSRAQRLIALLAISERPLSRSVVAARLWPDVVNARANASLRATLWSLPRDHLSPVRVEGNTLMIEPATHLDLTDSYGVANEILEHRCACEDVESAKLLDDLLPAWTDEWLMIERERFRQTRLHALDDLCVLLARSGRFARAIEAGLASVSSEPTRESAHRALMTAHLLEGNRMEAIRQYHTYLSIAKAEMGIGPSDRLQELFLTALNDAPSDESVTPR